LKQGIRKTDYVGRFGGEEFIIISPETNQENIYNLIEKIRFDIENYHFKNIGKVTVSFGISMLKEKDTASSLLKKADEALYKAKNSGRNKVLIYSEDK
ncbi:GGDEF domain-containing protein, partial [Arcobacteraceae bacterium]|nr:GGDEF domain-containing protein [Arcobacteraceae bacterium]